ncbi:ferritin-like domain-containing protein [Planosporangium sp. 12N6]|uniref:YciE/YciF ferroxidase family protein n=1 Tax=Planosporangium spinosum TaxID=3402278 RepID=UPI003CEDC0D0
MSDQEEFMALNSPVDLFLYELSGALDAEKKGIEWKGELIGQIRDSNVQQVLRTEQQEGQQKIKNLETCFQALGKRQQDVPCLAIDGMRAESQQFMSQNPSPQVLDMYVAGASSKLAHFGSATYKGLVGKATMMGDTRCAQALQANLVMKEDSATRWERVGHEVSQRVMATA